MKSLVAKFNALIELTQKLPVLSILSVKFYKFFIVGCTVFVIDFIIFRFLFDVIELRTRFFDLISLANLISVACSTVFGYYLNRTWSFENDADNVAAQFSKYAVVAILNNSLNNVFFGFFFYRLFNETGIINLVITSTVSKILATSFQAVSSFLAYKYIVFREEKEVLSETTVP